VTRRFSVEERVYQDAEGGAVSRAVVVHPGAVVILPLLDSSTIVMIRQYRKAAEEELFELPAGTLEPDEEPMQAAGRELIEETGYRAGSLEPFLEFFTSPGVLTERMRAFVARDLEWVGTRPEDEERIRVVPTTVDDARKKFLAGELRDAKTISVLGTYFARLHR